MELHIYIYYNLERVVDFLSINQQNKKGALSYLGTINEFSGVNVTEVNAVKNYLV